MTTLYEKTKLTPALQWTGDNFKEIAEFLGRVYLYYDQGAEAWTNPSTGKNFYMDATKVKGGLIIKTQAGELQANIGDYIAKGVEGEYRPIKPEIFVKTYRKVEEAEETKRHPLAAAHEKMCMDWLEEKKAKKELNAMQENLDAGDYSEKEKKKIKKELNVMQANLDTGAYHEKAKPVYNTTPDALKVSYKLNLETYKQHTSKIIDYLKKHVSENKELEALRQALLFEMEKNKNLEKENEALETENTCLAAINTTNNLNAHPAEHGDDEQSESLNIEELAEKLGIPLVIGRNKGQGDPYYYACFGNVNIFSTQDGSQTYGAGCGSTLPKAVDEYVGMIKGKRLEYYNIVDMLEKFVVPEYLTGLPEDE